MFKCTRIMDIKSTNMYLISVCGAILVYFYQILQYFRLLWVLFHEQLQ